MNKKVLVPLLVLVMIAFSIIPAMAIHVSAQAKGKPVTEFVWKVSLNRQAAILSVASGKVDVFAWSSPLPVYQGLNPAILAKLKLIRSASTHISIAINPAQNVIDPNAPGQVKLYKKSFKGQIIPGLIYWNPPHGNYINITDIKNYANLHFNPFALWQVRFALNFLINRQLIVDTIFGGSAAPALGCITPSHPAYPKLKFIYDKLGLTPQGNVQKSIKLFLAAMKAANQTLKKYHMMVVLKKDSSSPTGKFWYFVKPNGKSEPITIYFCIRIEDQRLYIGRQIATWLEKYWNLKVVRLERSRSVVTPVIYGKNLVDTSTRLGNVVWSLYTEGWVSMGEEPPVYARYDVAFFYGPLQGYGPNTYNTQWWYWWNATIYKLAYDLNYGIFTQKTVNKLWKEIEQCLYDGVQQSPRVFITEDWEFAPVNRQNVVELVPGRVTGIWSPWTLRTLETTSGKATIMEYSAQGALFMSAWNPVLGFTGVYSMLMYNLIADPAFNPSPINGMPVPVRVKGFKLFYNVTVPNTAYVFNSSMKAKKWVVTPYAGKKANELILNFVMGKWHDGSPITMADVLYWLGMIWDWSHDDSTKHVKDPYYDPEIAEYDGPVIQQIKGVQVLNSTAIAVYTTYNDVYPSLVANYLAPMIWPPMPWYVLATAEYMIVHGVKPSGSTVPYGWCTREGTSVGISFINPTHVKDVVKYMQKLMSEGYIPDYIKTYPGLSKYASYSVKEYQNGINFAKEYGNVMISNGPFYVYSYNVNSRTLVMKWFKDYPFPPGYWNTKFELYEPAIVGFKPSPPTLIVAGKSYSWDVLVKQYRILPSYAVQNPTQVRMYVKVYQVTSNGTKYLATLPESDVKLVKPGVVSVNLTSDFTSKYMSKPGAYMIQIILGTPQSGITVIKTIELTSLGTISPTTTTSTTTTTTKTTTTTVVKTTTTVKPTTTTIVRTTTSKGTVTIATTKVVTSVYTTTTTAIKPTTSTVTTTVYKTTTVATPSPTTVHVTTTNWGAVAAAAVILFIIGLIIGYFAKRR